MYIIHVSASPSPAWTARPSRALSGQPSAPSVSVPCPLSLRRRTRHWQYYRASLHLAAIQTNGAWCLHDLFSVLSAPVCLSACFRKTLYLRTVVIQLHRHQLGRSHDGDHTFYFFKYQLHTFLSYVLLLLQFYQYLFRY